MSELKDTENYQSALHRGPWKGKNASLLKNETLLVEVHNDKQLEILLKANLLGSYSRDIFQLHLGVVNSDSVDGIPDKEIQ
jgi:hypothetical protein